MENSTRLLQDNINFPIPSSPLNNNSNGVAQIHTPPLTPIPNRSETNPYPTTFVQADTTSFKQVVQMLTGSSETNKPQQPDPPKSSFPIPPIKTSSPKRQSFKLYERRNSNLKNSLIINTLVPSNVGNNNNSSNATTSFYSPLRNADILSPSLLDFPKLALSSPVTPLNIEDPLGNSSSEEDKAIAEKGFYLHPSPMSTPRDVEPQLLPLFPLTSPRV